MGWLTTLCAWFTHSLVLTMTASTLKVGITWKCNCFLNLLYAINLNLFMHDFWSKCHNLFFWSNDRLLSGDICRTSPIIESSWIPTFFLQSVLPSPRFSRSSPSCCRRLKKKSAGWFPPVLFQYYLSTSSALQHQIQWSIWSPDGENRIELFLGYFCCRDLPTMLKIDCKLSDLPPLIRLEYNQVASCFLLLFFFNFDHAFHWRSDVHHNMQKKHLSLRPFHRNFKEIVWV